MTGRSTGPLREVELKAVVPDEAAADARVRAAGAVLTLRGRLEDRRYDTGDRALERLDQVLRLRVLRGADSTAASLDWKGPTTVQDGYKVREEISTTVGDADLLVEMLARMGYGATRAIDRDITQYVLDGTVIRFERYPRMDTLVEVEGTPEGIERAIIALGIPRREFTAERLADFVTRFEQRTGERAAVCDAER